jgi:hypothetical protein
VAELAATLAMARCLPSDELQELLDATQPKRGIGRPEKPNTRLEVMSVPLSKKTIEQIKKLASERGVRAGALLRELALIGLRHADELPKIERNSNVSVTLGD